ncbi:WD40-repeat-containing domain protein [Mucor lusitanicus]
MGTMQTSLNFELYHVECPPGDGISALQFSTESDLLAASSWDNNVYIYDINLDNRESYVKDRYPHEAPVLCLKWSLDGSQIVSGGADHKGRLYDVETGKHVEFAHHEAPIKSILFADYSLVVTGSWDKTIKYWDLRKPGSAGTLRLSERVYAMDACRSWLVVGTADNNVHQINTMVPDSIMKTTASPLKHQMRKIRCFPEEDGFAISSIAGRVAIEYTEQIDEEKSFTFKCHRNGNHIYAVNDLDFHPSEQGTLLTAGSDGTISIWNKDKRQKLKAYSKVDGHIACAAFNRDGIAFAYAVSYDWSKGYKFATDTSNKIYIHDMEQFE